MRRGELAIGLFIIIIITRPHLTHRLPLVVLNTSPLPHIQQSLLKAVYLSLSYDDNNSKWTFSVEPRVDGIFCCVVFQ
jgi:hypothetical protein